MLSIMTFLPLAGAVIIAVLPRNDNAFRYIALGITFANFVLALITTGLFDRNAPTQYQWVENVPWIDAIGSRYHMGVDGVSVLMVMLDGLIFLLAIIASWKPIQTRVREYYFSMLLLNVGLVGVFCALDFFLFYIFWELVLIPMAVLIGVWGGQRRVYAAIKFFLYTLTGSLLMLVAIIALYFQYQTTTGRPATLDIQTITEGLAGNPLPTGFQYAAFLGFAAAFFVKIPLWPFHTWLPDAHTEAPTAGSVILAGVMLKMGCYGIIRFNLPLFPNASHDFAPALMIIAIIAIIYGAVTALVQPDMKKLVAYSSVSHMGFVVLGLFAFANGLTLERPAGEGGAGSVIRENILLNNQQGFDGAVFQMFSHGLLTGGLFLGVGVIYERLHTRDIKTIQNTLRIGNRMPAYASVYMLYTMGSLGLPIICGFVGEFLVFQSAFRVNGWYAFAASFVIIFAAVYMLWMYQRVFFGKVEDYDMAFVEKTLHEAHASGHAHDEPEKAVEAPSPARALAGVGAGHGSEHESGDVYAVASSEHGHDEATAHGHDEHGGHGHGHADKDMLRNGAKLPDLNFGEWMTLYPMAALAVVIGVVPSLVLDYTQKPAQQIAEAMVNNSQHINAAVTVWHHIFK